MLFPHFRLYFHYILLLSVCSTLQIYARWSCFPSCLHRRIFANDQAHSTLHQLLSHLVRSYTSLVNYKVTKQTSNRFRTQLYLRTGEISLQADLSSISCLWLLLVMTRTVNAWTERVRKMRSSYWSDQRRSRNTALMRTYHRVAWVKASTVNVDYKKTCANSYNLFHSKTWGLWEDW